MLLTHEETTYLLMTMPASRYPHCLFFLEMLQSPEFRKAVQRNNVAVSPALFFKGVVRPGQQRMGGLCVCVWDYLHSAAPVRCAVLGLHASTLRNAVMRRAGLHSHTAVQVLAELWVGADQGGSCRELMRIRVSCCISVVQCFRIN